MAPRSFWKGYLKLSLVTCPVTMEPARTAGETLRFHTVNRDTGNRVESRYVDSETGKPLAKKTKPRATQVREATRFADLEDEELEAVGLQSTPRSTSSVRSRKDVVCRSAGLPARLPEPGTRRPGLRANQRSDGGLTGTPVVPQGFCNRASNAGGRCCRGARHSRRTLRDADEPRRERTTHLRRRRRPRRS